MGILSNVSHEKTWTWLRKGNLKRETESLPIAAQNNAIRTNHIKVRIDKTQQNSKCRLWDETINHIISECSKLTPKEYKIRHDLVGRVIHWELFKKFKFDYTNKWYMHNPVSVLENDTHELQWDFDIQTDRLISARRPDLIIINNKKRTCRTVDIAVQTDHRIKLKESEKKDKYLDLAWELKKQWNMKVTITPIMRCLWCNGYRSRKWTRRSEFKSWTRMIAFHIALIPLGKEWIQLFSLQLWVNSRTDSVLQPWWGN